MPNQGDYENNSYDSQGGNRYSRYYNYGQEPLTRSQKIATAALAFFAVVVIIAWGVQFKRSLIPPSILADQARENSASNAAQNTDNTNPDGQNADRFKDTDGDGLSDWDEVNVYSTSPYLADSDSDTISDGDEIKKGTDPNCPEGRKCYTKVNNASTSPDGTVLPDLGNPTADNSGASSDTIANTLNSLSTDATDSGSAPAINTNNVNTNAASQILSGQIDAKSLRQALIDSGMDRALLDKISDEQLMKSYQDTLKK